MIEIELTAKEKVKLAIISQDLPDRYVEKLVLDFEITNEDDLMEIIGCLEKHRPRIAEHFLQMIRKNK